MTDYVDAYQTAIGHADDQGIEVDPENEAWVNLWTGYKKQLDLPRLQVLIDIP